jgi:hypothetical protein
MLAEGGHIVVLKNEDASKAYQDQLYPLTPRYRLELVRAARAIYIYTARVIRKGFVDVFMSRWRTEGCTRLAH